MAQGYWSMFHDTCFPFWYFKVHKSLDLDEEGVLCFTGLKTYQHDLPRQFDLSTGCSEQSFVLNSCMFALLQTLLCTVPDPAIGPHACPLNCQRQPVPLGPWEEMEKQMRSISVLFVFFPPRCPAPCVSDDRLWNGLHVCLFFPQVGERAEGIRSRTCEAVCRQICWHQSFAFNWGTEEDEEDAAVRTEKELGLHRSYQVSPWVVSLINTTLIRRLKTQSHPGTSRAEWSVLCVCVVLQTLLLLTW